MSSSAVHHVRVLEQNAARIERVGVTYAGLGAELSFDRGALARCACSRLDEVDADLLTVLAAVAFSDRRVSRRRGTAWSRRLNVSVPVHLPEVWEARASRLSRLLRDLTGDVWTFEFYARTHADELLQDFLPNLPRVYAGGTVIPYSGGLDSLTAIARQRMSDASEPLLLVHARHGSYSLESVLPERERSVPALSVPFTIAAGQHADPSYRTRTLVFFAIAALACRKTSARRVFIGESGIGCFGPALVPFGIEHPYRGCHPGFIDGLTKFLESLWGASPVFELPHLWRTKGEVLTELVEAGAVAGWERTRSCSRNVRRQYPDASATHCGLCSGCLYRRQSLHAAKLIEHDARYFVDVAAEAELGPPLKRADIEVGTYAVVGLDAVARLPATLNEQRGSLFELEKLLGESTEVVRARLDRLFASHRSEWLAFLDALPAESWMRRLAISTDGGS